MKLTMLLHFIFILSMYIFLKVTLTYDPVTPPSQSADWQIRGYLFDTCISQFAGLICKSPVLVWEY